MTCATVPGRVNLIGEWIDFNGGTVLPMALSQSVELEMCPNGQTHDRVQSQQFSDIADFGIDLPAAGHWSDYVRGGLQYGRRMGWLTGGQDVVLKSTIPVGAGLSSSAATIVATLRAAGAELAGIDPAGIARAAQHVENIFMGVPCGIMDQMAVSVGRPGNVLALDTRDCSYQIMPVPAGWTFAVIHSGIARALSDGRYRARRQECLEAAGSLGVPYLCDGKLEDTPSLPPRPGQTGASCHLRRGPVPAGRHGACGRKPAIIRNAHECQPCFPAGRHGRVRPCPGRDGR